MEMTGSVLNSMNFYEIKRPLWQLFDKLVTYLTHGRFSPGKFNFKVNEVSLSSSNTVLLIISLYYTLIFGGQYILKGTKSFKLNTLFQLHNFFLTTTSLILLILLLEQIIPIIHKNGLFFAICDAGALTQPIMTIYYINYLIKYFEFLDTFFLVLKHKKLTFLHTYHHGATTLLCYTELVGYTTISWVPISLNLAVHVLMYWYYFLSARGIRVWWKQLITIFQILQFILDLAFIYFSTYTKLVHYLGIDLPHCGDCFGSVTSNLAGCFIISSYLFLFISFYIETYTHKSTKV